MSGTGRRQSNCESREGSGIANASSEEDSTRATSSMYSSPMNPSNLPELFKGFYIQKPDSHIQWDSGAESSVDQTLPPPEVEEKPFVFEKPETDFHLQVTKGLLEEREERNLVTDDRGVPIYDCCGDHPTGFMCQFCDGRRGSWVQPNAKSTELFKQYQSAILSSPVEVCTDLAARDPGADEDRYALDFGIFDKNFFE